MTTLKLNTSTYQEIIEKMETNHKMGESSFQKISKIVLFMLSCVQLFATPSTVTHQAPLSMGFSRQEYWSGLPFPPPRDLPDPGIEPAFLRSPALSGRFFTTSATWKAPNSTVSIPYKVLASRQ